MKSDTPMAAPLLRAALPDDVPALTALIAFSARGLGLGYYTPAETEAAIAHVFGVDSALILDRSYFVAEVDGKLAGCGGWSARRTLFGGDQFAARHDDTLDPTVDAARIRAFFVGPAFARRGVGAAILTACEDAAAAGRLCADGIDGNPARRPILYGERIPASRRNDPRLRWRFGKICSNGQGLVAIK